MSSHIRDRIARKLETLGEDRLYQVLDYVEFLESRYAQRPAPVANPFQRFADGIEDRLRTGGVSAVRVAEAMGLLNRAVGVLNDVATGVAAAGKSVATDLASAAARVGTAPGGAPATGSTPGTTSGTTSGAPADGMPAGSAAPAAVPSSAPPQPPGGPVAGPPSSPQPGTQ